LSHIFLYLDKQFFAADQAYTALSRAPSWDVVEIPCLDKEAFSVDQAVISEYERLKKKEQLNISLCNLLQVTCEDDILLSIAIDKVNNEVWSSEHAQRMFKQHTNLPVKARLQTGARVMYLTNDMINQGVCNGTIGIVTNVIQQTEQIHVTFLGNRSLIHAVISPKTSYFSVNGTNAPVDNSPYKIVSHLRYTNPKD
jgi:ATP-dependent exoDNAse (exonuclease V) alpha subunit